MTDDQQLRHSRHLLLDEWSEAAQARLTAAHALVVGAGGLGAPALMYLAAAGVGRITVVDPDTVELSNLQRQIAHTTASVGQPKVVSAAHTLGRLNPEVQVQAVAARADAGWLAEHLHGVDVVLDCTDGFASRQAINQAAWCAGVPLVSAAALRWDGQITVFDAREPASPCYACLFPPEFPPEETRCALMGVFAPVVGTLGVVQAGEALKVLLRGARADAAPGPQGAWAAHEALTGRLLLLDGRSWRWTELRLKARAGCSVCGAGRPTATPGA